MKFKFGDKVMLDSDRALVLEPGDYEGTWDVICYDGGNTTIHEDALEQELKRGWPKKKKR